MDATLAQILNTLAGNSSPNVQPGGVSGARLAFMQGQNPIANQKMAGDVLLQNQQQQALAGQGNINPATLSPPPAGPQPPPGNQNAPQVSPMSGMPPGGGSPAPNPPPVQAQPLPPIGSGTMNVPLPGATPMPQVNASALQPGASGVPSGPIPPPPTPQQMPPQGQQPPAPPQAPQIDPQVSQVIHQNMLGPQAPQYADVIKAVKEAMPNATPQARAMAIADVMKDVNSQTSQLLKQYQEALMQQRLGQSAQRMDINQDRLDLAKDKAGLGTPDATGKILNFQSLSSQAKAAGAVGGKTNAARADAQAAAEVAAKSALSFLPPDQNKVQGWLQKGYADFENSPEFTKFEANNTAVAGEIARALAGGGLPRAGLTDQIAKQLNAATDQKAWLGVKDAYMQSTAAAAGATSGVVGRGGAQPTQDDNTVAGSPPSETPAPPPGFVVQ